MAATRPTTAAMIRPRGLAVMAALSSHWTAVYAFVAADHATVAILAATIRVVDVAAHAACALVTANAPRATVLWAAHAAVSATRTGRSSRVWSARKEMASSTRVIGPAASGMMAVT